MAAPATRDFDPGRISPGETIAGAAGIGLFLFLFFHWFTGLSAWSAFDVIDFVLAAIAIVAVGVAGGRAMGNDIFGSNTGLVLTLLGVVASSMILTFVLEGDGRKIGLYLALISALALAYGGWRTLNEAPGTPGPLAGAGGAPTTPMAATDPVPGQNAPLTPPGLAGEPPAGEGTHPPGL